MAEKTAESKERRQSYVEAIIQIATAEGKLEQTAEELHKFSDAMENSRELYDALSDAAIPTERRQQIVDDLLSPKAGRITLGLISMLISAGRIKDFPHITQELSKEVARQKNLDVAYVRTAVELDEKQRAELKKALSQATKKELDLKIVIDPELLGGVVATIGDTVIDGSLKSRLQKLKEAMEVK